MATFQKKLRCKESPINLWSRRYIWLLALLLLSCVNTTCFGQTVRIRIVNGTDETPVKDQRVSVSGISGKEETQQEANRQLLTKPTTPDLRLVTDARGEAQFELPKPAPAYFYVHAELSGPVWDCGCLVRVSTEEVMQKGFMVVNPHDNKGSRTKPSIQPKPGEILFNLTPTQWWVRVLWPFLTDHRL
jgi:hypothetical protein